MGRILSVLVLAAVTALGCTLPFGASTPTPRTLRSLGPFDLPGAKPLGPTQIATVTFVVDGDTIRVQMLDGQGASVRYIGIDAPERETEPLWEESTQANAELIDGREVFMEKDVSETDQHGRLLRHVWLPTGDGWLLINAEMVRLGMADAKTYPPDTLWDPEYAAAESEARSENLGIWASERIARLN